MYLDHHSASSHVALAHTVSALQKPEPESVLDDSEASSVYSLAGLAAPENGDDASDGPHYDVPDDHPHQTADDARVRVRLGVEVGIADVCIDRHGLKLRVIAILLWCLERILGRSIVGSSRGGFELSMFARERKVHARTPGGGPRRSAQPRGDPPPATLGSFPGD